MKKTFTAGVLLLAVVAPSLATLPCSNLVAGISRLFDAGAPGWVQPLDSSWTFIVAGSATATPAPSDFVMARGYGAGRIIVTGHESIFGDASSNYFDNATFMVNVLNWLDNGGSRTLFITQGHQEWLSYGSGSAQPGMIQSSTWLQRTAKANGFSVVSSPAPINENLLAASSVLIIGNAWGSFTPAEIEEVGNFVASGGGLVLTGVGWSWLAASPQNTMQNYPMQQMANQFDATWGATAISDAVNGINGTPIFTTFYPYAFPLNTNGEVLWLPFDEGAGTVAHDFSGNANFGTILGATWTNGVLGSALYFDGTDQVIVSNSPSLNPRGAISIAAWIKADNWNGNNRILEKGYGDQYALFCGNSGSLIFSLNGALDGNASTNSGIALPNILVLVPPGQWHHLAATYNGAEMQVFIDGIVVAQQAATGFITNTAENLTVGDKAGSGNPIDFFQGAVDDVRVYSVALSPAAVFQLYASVSPPSLTVTLLPAGAVSAGAQWQINGGAALNSGVTVTNLPEGSYTVSFTAIPGWDTPSNQVITVTNGALTTLTAVYTPSLATITAVANPMSGGVVSGAGSFVVGSQVQILATASNGWVFSSWNDGDTQNPRIVTVPSGGATYAANFTFVPIRASYYGLFYDTNDIAFQSSGYFSLAMTAKGTFSATLLTAGKVYPFSGSFSTTGSASNSVSVSKAERLTVMLGFDSGGLDVLTGEITDGNWTAQLVANREVFSATNPAPQAGKYTVLIPGSRDAAVQPGGYGFGTVTVDPLGNLKFSGTLGDGTAVSQTAVVSEEGKWPLYDSPYSGNGSIIGWLTFTNQPASDIMGTVTWTKLPRPTAKYYSAGFTNQTDAVGSLFQFTNGIPVLDFAAGELWLTNGNLSQSFTNWFTLGGNNKVTSTNKMSLTIATSSGLFTGSIVNPATKKSISIHGAVLQKQSLGAGYFLGTNESGGVLLGVAP